MFVTPAFAQAAGAPGPGAAGLSQLVMLGLLFGIMYFLLIRPQQKKAREHRALVEALRRGDEVITQGGLVGKIAQVREDGVLDVEIAPGVKVRIMKQAVAQVVSKTEPVA